MKKIIIILILFNLGCRESRQEIDPLSFQNQWGVAYFVYPRYPTDGCSYRAFFLPFKNKVNIDSLTNKASVFDFEYRPGICFNTSNPIFLDQLRSASIKNIIHMKGNTDHIVFWSFVKLKYSSIVSNMPQILNDNVDNDTLSSRNLILPFRYYKLNRSIKIDTAFTKQKYSNPWNKPDLRTKMKHFYMPCFILPSIHL